ncbi:MAG TPA: NAD-dependent epimerase/dehydratase family protein [Dehalococcoidia bacterium]|nr:NAD-dependent epimerase/dehydratase family protein [Dehalococcoidia bacterium]
MRIFVTGATGVLGKAVLPVLAREGHQVRALSRSPQNAELIRKLGAEPVSASLYEPNTLRPALAGSEAVLHLASRIPPTRKVRSRAAWRENDRIRLEGTTNLVDALLETGSSVLVFPSVTFAYPDSGDRWIDAQTVEELQPARFLQSVLHAEQEVHRFADGGRRGVVLRLGLLYGPESPQTDEILSYAGRGFAVIPGRADAYQPLLWIQDAATALVAALQAPAGVYDVVDDEPLTRAEFRRALAETVGKRNLRRLPFFLARLLSGGDVAGVLARSQRVSNRRFKEVSTWSPSVRSAREGLSTAISQPRQAATLGSS